MMLRILRYICALLLFSSPIVSTAKSVSDSTVVRGIQYASQNKDFTIKSSSEKTWFSGASLSADLVGLVMMAASSHGQAEAALRLNIKNKYFPIAEVGWGICDHREYSTGLHYKMDAPYYRIGCDYNFYKNRTSGNRIFAGLRYAFTSFRFDLDGPPIVDPLWGTTTPYSFNGVKSSMGWGELVFGLEAKIWKFFHLGWSFRYKVRLHEKKTSLGHPWFVPGYGKNGGSALGGTFNIVFDL